MALNYHIIIIVLLLVVIFLLLILFNKKNTIEKFYNQNKHPESPYKLDDYNEENCKKWASYGECTSNWQNMIEDCPTQCKEQVNDIKKHNKKCEDWAKRDFCNDKNEKEYMHQQCSDFCD